MPSIRYGFEFSLNKILGNSILKNPMELIGLVILLGAMIFVIVLTNKLSKSYREKQVAATLYWALAFAFLLAASILLILEKISFSTLGEYYLGNFFAVIALITSGAAIVCFDIFAFHTTFPEKVKILTSFVLIGASIYVIALAVSIIADVPYIDVINYELVYTPIVDIIVYCTLIPIIVIAPITFYYYSMKMKKENTPHSKRAFWLGNGLICFAIGYIAEVAPFFPPVLSIPFRVFLLLSAYIMYVCFVMPDWFKNKIGWTG